MGDDILEVESEVRSVSLWLAVSLFASFLVVVTEHLSLVVSTLRCRSLLVSTQAEARSVVAHRIAKEQSTQQEADKLVIDLARRRAQPASPSLISTYMHTHTLSLSLSLSPHRPQKREQSDTDQERARLEKECVLCLVISTLTTLPLPSFSQIASLPSDCACDPHAVQPAPPRACQGGHGRCRRELDHERVCDPRLRSCAQRWGEQLFAFISSPPIARRSLKLLSLSRSLLAYLQATLRARSRPLRRRSRVSPHRACS